MRQLLLIALASLGLAACQTSQQTAGTATGVAAGAVVGGPVGAVVGGAVGAAATAPPAGEVVDEAPLPRRRVAKKRTTRTTTQVQ